MLGTAPGPLEEEPSYEKSAFTAEISVVFVMYDLDC